MIMCPIKWGPKNPFLSQWANAAKNQFPQSVSMLFYKEPQGTLNAIVPTITLCLDLEHSRIFTKTKGQRFINRAMFD